MRKEFSAWLEKKMSFDHDVIFLTGDLGFQAFENISSKFANRFINVGVAEQNMINIAAGLASENLKPICYSIAPFAVFRPFEQIRINLALHNYKVMIVGNGGGYGYGIMGATHHALEDIGALSTLKNFTSIIPFQNSQLEFAADYCLTSINGPSYLRMGFGISDKVKTPTHFQTVSQLASGDAITIIGMGPVILNAINALDVLNADIFAINQMPLISIDENILRSIRKTKKILILEEHVLQGGLGQSLIYQLHMMQETDFRFIHRYALGYPNGTYGDQSYHQVQSGLDTASIITQTKSL